MSTIILEGFITVPEAELEHVKEELSKHIKLTRAEEGCRKFIVEQDENNECQFNVYEEFSSREAFDFHQQRVKISNWGKITINVERHYTITEQD